MAIRPYIDPDTDPDSDFDEDWNKFYMRTDLTSSFQAAMAAAGRKPRQLAVFHFADGDVYVSDQALGAADGLGSEYEALVEEWGDLRDAGDPMDPYSSDVRQMTLTLWNGGDSPFSDRFLSQDPENVEVDVYQWFYGQADAHKALIDRFVCQDPIATDEVSRLLRVDLVSLPMRYDGPLGGVIKVAEWPDAPDESLGKYLPVVLGDPGYVSTICVRSAPLCTLNGSVLDDTMVIPANEDLDEEGFAQSGTIQIGSERMTYSSRTDAAFTISQRGADGTTASEHLNQAQIQQHVTDFTYLVADHALGAIANVKVAGLPAPASIYTAYESLSPARIVFSEKPYALDYAKGSTFLEMQFDAVSAANTALQPHLAYDPASVTSAAQISESNPLLAVKQETVNPDRGEIVKAYLGVEWWASDAALQHDRIKVAIVGVGDLGYLERPSQEDTLTLDAEVDIDHGHSHSISGEHTHTFTDPTVATQESAHGHASSGLSDQLRVHGNTQLSLTINATGSVSFQGPGAFSSATLHCRTSPNYGCKVYIGGNWVLVGSGDSYTAVSVGAGTISLTFKNTQWSGGTMMIYEIWIDYVITSSIAPAYTGVTAAVLTSGANATESDKATTDVNDLAAENREIELNSSGLPTRSVVELFDVTEQVALDWGWFTGIEAQVQYEGTVDDQTVYLLHVFFDVEYRRVETIFSDEVTCEPQGLVDDADGTYTGTPLSAITRPDHVRKYLLMNRGGLPEARIDSESFAAAGARFAAEDYTFDGVLQGDMTVREAEKQLARECRSRWYWDAGCAFMKFREYHDDWTIDKTWVQATAPLRIKGMAMERKAVKNIINRVHLYYYRDWKGDSSGVEAYASMAAARDNESISAHGIRERPDSFFFNLVRNPAMATDLAEFYLQDGKPSSFYTIEAFLGAFDLQKEDHIRLSHDFTSLNKAALRIAGIERVFGSGKLKRMNLLRLIAETWYRLISVAKQDQVKVADILNIELVMGLDFHTGVGVTDFINFGFNHDETVSVADALSIIVTWVIAESDTVTCADALTADMQIAIGDSVRINEFLDTVIGRGFGMGSFGMDRFGSLSQFDANPEDFVAAMDTLVANLSAVLSDSVTCSDSIVFSSGFGSPWTEDDGFGEVPFGS